MEILKRKNGTRYKEKVYTEGGGTLTKTFKRKTDAIAWKNRITSDRERGLAVGIVQNRVVPSFGVLATAWIDRRIRPFKVEKTTYEYQSILKKHLLPRLHDLKVNDIKTLTADGLVIELKAQGAAPKRINKIIGVLKQVLTFAKSEGQIEASPLVGYPQLKVPPRKDDFLLSKEIELLLRATHGERIHSLIVVAVNTGMRLGELTGLCWDRVNFETKQIEITRTMDRKGLRNTTKTNKGRFVPMNEVVETLLKNLMWLQLNPQFVFVDENNRPYNPDHISSRQFKRALDKAGVRKIRFHDLRHTFASHWMMNNGSIYDLQKILGHSKIEMTMKYAHLSPSHLAKVANTVRFSAASSPDLALEKKSDQQVMDFVSEK